MSDPLVSVLIPCFNAARYIKQAVQSCLSQKWANLEVIVVDDGSTDQSLVVLRSIHDARLKICQQPNKGASSARNYAYQQAQGLYIQHLDADDFLDPLKIAGQMKAILSTGGEHTICLAKTIYFYDGEEPQKGIVQDAWPLVDHDNPMEWLIEMLGPEKGSMVQPGSWLTPRTISDVIGPWNESIDPSPDVDGEYFARAVLASKKIRRSTEGIAYYRKYRTSRSMSMQRSQQFLAGGLRSLDMISSLLLSKTDTPRAKKALGRRYKEWAFTCYPHAPQVTRLCLTRAAELGFGSFEPEFPTKAGRVLSSLFGWKVTKRLNHIYHTTKKYLETR